MSNEIAGLMSRPPAKTTPLRKVEPPNLVGSRKRLLEALNNIRYGTLTLTLPDSTSLVFEGVAPGEAAHLELRDWRALDEIFTRGQMGFADAYINGLLNTDDLPGLITFIFRNEAAIETYFNGRPWYGIWLKARNALHANTKGGSRRNVAAHYDVGNAFFELWLDRSMTYSCGLFEGDPTRSLEAAQAAKYRRILSKLDARPGQHILEIGCGWGGFAEAAAREGLNVKAITLSKSQADYARKRIERAGLQNRVTVEITDYREVEGQFDHIVSIGMFEHVGEAYWPGYFQTIKRHLKPDGKAMIQTIITTPKHFDDASHHPGFIETYIFPGGRLPAPEIFRDGAEKAGLVCREMFTFGQDYKRTLEVWLDRFEANLGAIRAQGYNEPFIRLWRLYFSACIAAFATERTSVMQVELSHY